MVILDSNHQTEFVSQELSCWKHLVSCNQYLVVEWTIIGESDNSLYLDKAWGKNSNPLIAVNDFLCENSNFIRNNEIEKNI